MQHTDLVNIDKKQDSLFTTQGPRKSFQHILMYILNISSQYTLGFYKQLYVKPEYFVFGVTITDNTSVKCPNECQ